MRAVPLSARVRPARIEISVVLPAPFGPEQSEEFAGLDRQAHAGERLHAAETAHDVGDFDGDSHGRLVSEQRQFAGRAKGRAPAD